MLFIAERVAELAAISSRELRLLCAIAPALDSAKTVANVIVETFIVISPVGDSNHTAMHTDSVSTTGLRRGTRRQVETAVILPVRLVGCVISIAIPQSLARYHAGLRSAVMV